MNLIMKTERGIDDLLKTDRCIHSMEYRWLDLKKMPVWIHCKGYLVRMIIRNLLYDRLYQ